MDDSEKEKHLAAARIQSIQRGKSIREEKRQKDLAAAKIQSLQRGRSTRINEQKMKEQAAAKLQSTSDAVSGNDPDVPQSDELNQTTGTNFGAETRVTDFIDTGDEIRGGETINNAHIEKFCTFTKKDGHFTGLYPETTEALLSSPRPPSRLEAAKEEMIVNVGPEQYKSVHSNYKFTKWFSRKSNGILTRKVEKNFICPVSPEPENAVLLIPKERTFRTNGIFPDAPLCKF